MYADMHDTVSATAVGGGLLLALTLRLRRSHFDLNALHLNTLLNRWSKHLALLLTHWSVILATSFCTMSAGSFSKVTKFIPRIQMKTCS